MKKNKFRNERRTARSTSNASNLQTFVGTWEEEPNIGGTTTVVYKVSVKGGRFAVTAWDSEDGTEVKISQVKWKNDTLRFTSFYPPGKHTANHVMRPRPKGKLNHTVSGIYADGEAFSVPEVWIRSKKQRPKAKPVVR